MDENSDDVPRWQDRFGRGLMYLASAGALAASAPTLLGAREVAVAASVDGLLAAMLVVAYVCTRGWRSWSVREPN